MQDDEDVKRPREENGQVNSHSQVSCLLPMAKLAVMAAHDKGSCGYDALLPLSACLSYLHYSACLPYLGNNARRLVFDFEAEAALCQLLRHTADNTSP